MYVIYRKTSPNKIRDINIAIAYHNTGSTLKDIALQFNMSATNVRRIHDGLVRHISRCVGLKDVYFHTERKNHSEKMSIYLQEYKSLLENNDLKTVITLNDDKDFPVLKLTSCTDHELVNICLNDDTEGVNISMEEIRMALKKIVLNK